MPKKKSAKKNLQLAVVAKKKTPKAVAVDKKKKKKKKKHVSATLSSSGQYVAYNPLTGQRIVMSGATASRQHPLYRQPGVNGTPMTPVQYFRNAAFNMNQFINTEESSSSSSSEEEEEE